MKVGPWIVLEGGCGATRIREGGDVNKIEDRVAFIEKTPRIRIREAYFMSDQDRRAGRDFLNWASGPFKGDGQDDPESREWCDKALVLFGYEL